MISRRCFTSAMFVSALLFVHQAAAEAPRTAVFGFELLDTSPLGGSSGESANVDDKARLLRLDAQLLQLLAASGRYAPMAVAVDPWARSLRTCDGCEVDLARAVGAQVSVIGWVQKVSTLILNINLVVRDVTSGERIGGGSVDIRGDTDESWSRGLAYLLRNRILASRASTP